MPAASATSTGQEYGWIAIRPGLRPDGAFAALRHLPHASELKPIPLDREHASFDTDNLCISLMTVSAAARLGLAGVVDLSSSYRSTTMVYDHMVYSEEQAQQANGGLIIGTRWGAGLRVKVTVHEFDAQGSLNFPAVAAKASLGKVDASFEIQGLGFCDPAILKELPPPGRFDLNTLRLIDECAAGISKRFVDSKTGLTAVPFMIRVANPAFFEHPIVRAKSFLYGVRGVAYQNPLGTALEKAERTIDPIAVRSVYAAFASGAPDQGPLPLEGIEKARRWLEACDIPWRRGES